MRDVELMFPHDPVFFRDGLAREIATGLLARLTVEEVTEVIGLDLREVALTHLRIL